MRRAAWSPGCCSRPCCAACSSPARSAPRGWRSGARRPRRGQCGSRSRSSPDARYTGAPDQPFFALIVGTGARSDDPAESAEDPGLADAIHVIGVNPALGAATILDIPRDTEGPGGAKLNSYIVNSDENFGLRAEADAVAAVTGLPITYVVRANFPNFSQMVDEIGGIDVDMPFPLVDENSGANFAVGPNHLNGEQALAALARPLHAPARRHRPDPQPGPADLVRAQDDPDARTERG